MADTDKEAVSADRNPEGKDDALEEKNPDVILDDEPKKEETAALSTSDPKEQEIAAPPPLDPKKPIPSLGKTYDDTMTMFNSLKSVFIYPRIFEDDPEPGCCQIISSADVKNNEEETLLVVRSELQSRCQSWLNCCNPLNMKLFNAEKECVIRIEAPGTSGFSQCFCFCCYPQEIGVYCLLGSAGEKFIGSISLTSFCFAPGFTILDEDQTHKYDVEGPCQLQLQVCCACCSHSFAVTHATKDTYAGDIEMRSERCCKAKFGKPRISSEVSFNSGLDGEDRILLLALALFVEHLYAHRHFLP